MKNKNQLRFVVAILMFLLIIVLAGCGGGDKKKPLAPEIEKYKNVSDKFNKTELLDDKPNKTEFEIIEEKKTCESKGGINCEGCCKSPIFSSNVFTCCVPKGCIERNQLEARFEDLENVTIEQFPKGNYGVWYGKKDIDFGNRKYVDAEQIDSKKYNFIIEKKKYEFTVKESGCSISTIVDIKITNQTFIGENNTVATILINNPDEQIERINLTTNFPIYAEEPPLSIGKNMYLISTSSAYACNVEGNIYLDSTTLDAGANCTLISSGLEEIGQPDYPEPSSLNPALFWRRSYYSPQSAQIIVDKIYLFNHGENKNSRGTYCYQNTINKDVLCENCSSGVNNNGIYEDCMDAYNAFIGMEYVSIDQQMTINSFNDAGPVLWPSDGYIDSEGHKISNGLKEVSSIMHDGYVYLFTSMGSKIVVARAQINPNGELGNFKYYFDGDFNENALPEGFSKENGLQFLDKKSGKLTHLFKNQDELFIKFTVAKIKSTDYFIGVEDFESWKYTDKWESQWNLALRISKDLVHWGERVIIPQATTDGGWINGRLHYALFASTDGKSNNEIDPDNFYLIGTHSGVDDEVNRLRMSISIKPANFGSLFVESEPSDSSVYLDGAYKGLTPLALNELNPNLYEIKLSKDGYQNSTASWSVVAGETRNLSIALKPIILINETNQTGNTTY